MPQMIDRTVYERLWQQHPEIMSDVASAAFRHPNLTNTLALHHSEAVHGKSESGLQSRIENAVLELSGPLPRSQRRWMEVVFGSVGDWRKRMADIAPEPAALPGILSLQDDLGNDMPDGILELDCLREKWLSKLLPTPSSFEDPNSPPSMCKAWRERDRGTIFERLIGRRN